MKLKKFYHSMMVSYYTSVSFKAIKLGLIHAGDEEFDHYKNKIRKHNSFL